jgi:sugar-specific transcriptional regulator TrmB
MNVDLQEAIASIDTQHSTVPKKPVFNQPLTTIEDTLKNFGMQKNEIKIYLYLAEAGLKKATDICDAIAIHRTESYRLLRNLTKKGLVYTVLEKPIKFSAIPPNEAIDLLVDTQKTRLQMIENQKEALIEFWKSKPQRKCEPAKKELFQKLESQQRIILKANEILERTQREFQVFISDEYITELYYGGFFDNLKKHRGRLDITLLMGLSQKSTYFVDKAKWPKNSCRMIETQTLPTFIISDNKELIAAFTEGELPNELGHKKKHKNTAVWTTYPAIVSPLQMLFKKLAEP